MEGKIRTQPIKTASEDHLYNLIDRAASDFHPLLALLLSLVAESTRYGQSFIPWCELNSYKYMCSYYMVLH